MKTYQFEASPDATEAIDELAAQCGLSAAEVVREGLRAVASRFNRVDLNRKLEPTDCVGLSDVSGEDALTEIAMDPLTYMKSGGSTETTETGGNPAPTTSEDKEKETPSTPE